MSQQKVFLCILDGWGLSDDKRHNAIHLASTPNMDYLMENYLYSQLEASGNAVGLPHGQIGNSEIGHMTIGAGRVIGTDLLRINKEIINIKNNENFARYTEQIKGNRGNVHIIGLLSDGGVHSHIDHIKTIDDCLQNNGVKTFIHAITDGRDCDQKSAKKFITGIDNIATISGRYYAMDRDNNLERTRKYLESILYGSSEKFLSAEECIEYNYSIGITDEFILPSVIQNIFTPINHEDGIIICNYRADRIKQILKLLLQNDITKNNILGFVPYSKDLQIDTIFTKKSISNTLGEVLAQNNLKQLRIAETEKYAHITYFFSGNSEIVFQNEDRILIPSPKVATYDLKPEMSAELITDKVLDEFLKYEFILMNYANPDMVGHTGNLNAAIKAVEFTDKCVGRLVNAFKNYPEITLIITADHGNIETMINSETNTPHTAHTLNKVPFILINKKYHNSKGIKLKDGSLPCIAPTILYLMGVKQPKDMIDGLLINY